MKKYLIVVGMLFFISAAFAQESKKAHPPAPAQEAFKKNYPTATGVKWGNEDGNFEVNFMLDKKEMSAVYTKSGELIETEEEIAKSDLPAPIADYVKKHYNQSIKEAAKITKSNGEVNYEAEVGGKDLVFNKDGKFIKQEKD